MKAKSKPKIKKNKIPFCPRKINPVKKIIKINPEIPLIKHYKHPSTPMTLLTKKFEIKFNNKNETKKDSMKINPFHAIIPKRNNSEKKIRNKKVIIIKKPNNSNKIGVNSTKIKYVNNSGKTKNLNNSKSDTKCDTTSGLSSVFSDRNIKQRNNKNISEFTFSNSDFINNKTKKNDINLLIRNTYINKTNAHYSYHKNKNKNRITHLKKNHSFKNIKCINTQNDLKEKIINNNKAKTINKRSFSKEVKNKNKYKSKDKDNCKKKTNSKINKTSKVNNKFLSLIPFDKNHQLKKKLYINKDSNNKKNNDNSKYEKNKENIKQIHKLLLNISPKKFIRTNKSNPKLCIKHPSLKNFFDF